MATTLDAPEWAVCILKLSLQAAKSLPLNRFPRTAFVLPGGSWTPVQVQAIAVPKGRQLPSLRQGKCPAAWPIPLAAPAVDVLFRPEQEHRASGEYDVFVPVARRYREVDDAFGLLK